MKFFCRSGQMLLDPTFGELSQAAKHGAYMYQMQEDKQNVKGCIYSRNCWMHTGGRSILCSMCINNSIYTKENMPKLRRIIPCWCEIYYWISAAIKSIFKNSDDRHRIPSMGGT